jgi:diguanylate cyclase
MTGLHKQLPKYAWLRIQRITGVVTALSIVLSVVMTNAIMETFSAGVNVQGLAVSILTPLALGGPMIFFLMLKHEQLRHANRQLEKLATTDWLTACLNRGAFTRAVTQHLGASRRQGALLFVDADDFKGVNDRFGHDQGDEALRLLAAAIQVAVSEGGIVGRLGGEEFGVFLPDADPVAADRAAEQIRSMVAAIAFEPGGMPCPLSVSIGGTTFAGPAEFSELYRLADQRLYDAKNSGRDCVAMMQAA